MKIVGDNYVNSTEFNNVEEVTETFNEMSRTVVNQQLSGAIKICEKFTKTPEGKFKCYMAMELSADKLAMNTMKNFQRMKEEKQNTIIKNLKFLNKKCRD